MLHTRARRLHIGLISGLLTAAAVAVPIVLTAGGAAPVSASGPDLIVFSQKKSGSYVQYEPGGATSGTGVVTQAISTGSGGCSNPAISGSPVLAITAAYFPGGTYGVSPSAAFPGLYNLRTGVGCDGNNGQAWAVEPNEDLIFKPGSYTTTANRAFDRATIPLQNNDGKNPSSGQLVLSYQGVAVATIPFTLTANQQLTLDTATTNPNAVFDTLEVQVPSSPGGTVSVVGPTQVSSDVPTFYLVNQVCPGGQIMATGTDGNGTKFTETINDTSPAGTPCKSYTGFSADFSANPKTITFNTLSGSTNAFSAVFDWGYFNLCEPGGNTAAGQCGYIQVSFDGKNYTNETPCVSAPAADGSAWCVTKSTYDNVTYNNTASTHLTETWSGFGDPTWR